MTLGEFFDSLRKGQIYCQVGGSSAAKLEDDEEGGALSLSDPIEDITAEAFNLGVFSPEIPWNDALNAVKKVIVSSE